MARDYAKRPNKKRGKPQSSVSPRKGKKKSSISPFTWLVTGVLVGLVIGAVAYLKLNIMPKEPTSHLVKTKPASSKEKTLAKSPPPPKFDFYSLLPEMEVKVTEPAAEKKAAPRPQLAQDPVLPHPLEHVRYRLQLASFKTYQDADTLKAKLALSGHLVEIHPIKLDNGTIWYRVYTPALANRESALSLQKELQAQAINSMLLKDREG